jgi:hypothetical protein
MCTPTPNETDTALAAGGVPDVIAASAAMRIAVHRFIKKSLIESLGAESIVAFIKTITHRQPTSW